MTVHSLSAIHSASRPGVPISSDVGTCNSAPKNRGVKTTKKAIRSSFKIFDEGLTVSLNRIVRDTTQHGKPFRRGQAESLAHPREEVCQTVMPSFDALRDTGTSTSETQRGVAVRSKDNSSGCRRKGLICVEDVA